MSPYPLILLLAWLTTAGGSPRTRWIVDVISSPQYSTPTFYWRPPVPSQLRVVPPRNLYQRAKRHVWLTNRTVLTLGNLSCPSILGRCPHLQNAFWWEPITYGHSLYVMVRSLLRFRKDVTVSRGSPFALKYLSAPASTSSSSILHRFLLVTLAHNSVVEWLQLSASQSTNISQEWHQW